MTSLGEYLNKNVIIMGTDGEVLNGVVSEFFDKDDFESEFDSIELCVRPGVSYEIPENEIKSIQLA